MSLTLLDAGPATAGAAAWTPAQLPGLSWTFFPVVAREQGLMWQDLGRTTPAVADGDLVRVIECPFTGTEFSTPDDATRGTLKTDGSGHWWIGWATDSQYDTPPASAVTGDWSVYAVGSAAAGNNWIPAGHPTGTASVWAFTAGANVATRNDPNSRVEIAFTLPAGRFMVRTRRSGDDVLMAYTGVGEVNGGPPGILGDYTFGAVGFMGGSSVPTSPNATHGCVVLVNGTVSAADDALLRAYIAQYEGVTL